MGRRLDPELWNRRFAELKEYKKTHEDYNVPKGYPENSALGDWVAQQRKLGRKGKLAVDRFRRLEELGFVFELRGVQWDDQFENWRRFKQEHGHGNVPQKYAPNPALGHWVMRQRYSNNKGELSEERKKLLEDAGFIWKPVTTSKRRAARRTQRVKRKAGAGFPIIRDRTKKTRKSAAAKISGGVKRCGAWNSNWRKSASSPRKDDEGGHSCKRAAGKVNATSTRSERASMRSQQKDRQIDARRWNEGGNNKLEREKQGKEQPGDVEQKVREDEVTDGNFEVEAQEGADGRIETSQADPVGDDKRGDGTDEEGDDPLEPGTEEETSAKEPATSTGGTSLDGDAEEGGDALVQDLLPSFEDRQRVKEEYPIALAANPSPPVGQTEHDEPDYKDLCDKLTTKVYEYKEKISSLERETQSLKEEVCPIVIPSVRKAEPDELDGAFYKELCDGMTKWLDGHKAKFTSLKREYLSLKDEVKEEHTIVLAANPSLPVEQSEHDEPDYKDLCDKLTTKVYEYKEKISSLKCETQSLKEQVCPFVMPSVGKTEPDKLDEAFYRELCSGMTKWLDRHKAIFTSLKREYQSLKDEVARRKVCAKVPK